jgi:transcriptional regulator with XRE-family HTH domain
LENKKTSVFTSMRKEVFSMDIGNRMKELRIQYGLTQQELADRSELSKGFISQLERNLTSPSIGTLLDLIQCLGTTPAEFFTDQEPEQLVFKDEDYFEKDDEDTKSRVEWLVPNAQKNSMEPLRLTLQPGGTSQIYEPHEGEEFGYVLKGAVKIYHGARSIVARQGESFYLHSGKKHYIECAGGRPASLIWVSTPPSF